MSATSFSLPGARRLKHVWTAAAVAVTGLFWWVVTAGGWGLTQRYYFDNFFDAQARSIFDGRLDVPAAVADLEGFINGGKTYIYFGLFPAVLRMPVLAVTDGFDARLTTLSMLLAFVVLAVGSFRLSMVIRRLVRGAVRVGRVELAATSLLAAAVLLGPPLFLASGPIVYNEAILWGLALSVLGYDAAVRWQLEPTGRRLALAGVVITAAMLSRQTVAVGPLVTLGLFGIVRLWHIRQSAGARFTRDVVALLLTVAIPLGLSTGLHYARLGVLFGLPLERQVLWGQFAEVSNLSVFGPQHLAKTVPMYFQPVGIELRPDLPWIDFRTGLREQLDQDAALPTVDWTASLPSTAPLLCALTIWGLFFCRRGARSIRFWPFNVGTVAGALGTLLCVGTANRYLNDLYPIVLIGGLVGFHRAGDALTRRSRRQQRTALATMAVLVAVGGIVNLALTLETQRERWWVVPEDWQNQWLGWRVSLPGAPSPRHVGTRDQLPFPDDGALLVVGDCDGLYNAMRDEWRPVERGPGVGVYNVRVDIDKIAVGRRQDIIWFGQDAQSTVISLIRVTHSEARIDVKKPGSNQWILGWPTNLGQRPRLRIDLDPRSSRRYVQYGWQRLNPAQLPPTGPVPMSQATNVSAVPHDPSICRRTLQS